MMLFYIALTLPLIAFAIAADAMLRTWLWPQMPELANPAAAISGASIAAICVLAILSGLVAAFCTRDCWKVRCDTERTRL